MGKDFVDLARQGENAWWRYLASILLIVFGWLAVSILLVVVTVAIVMLDDNPATVINLNTGQFEGVDPIIMLGVSLFGSLPLIAALFVAVRFIHQRPFLTLITTRPRIDLKRIGLGFGFFLILVIAASLIEALLFPGRYQVTWDAKEFLKFVPFALVLVPIQTTAEELLFRGYLLQSVGLATGRPIIAATISSLLFMVLHLANPEVQVDLLLLPAYYFGVGLVLALVTLRDNRLELAIGAHTAINLFVFLFANYVGSVLSSPAVFTVSELDPQYALVSFAVMGILFYAGLFARRRAVPVA